MIELSSDFTGFDTENFMETFDPDDWSLGVANDAEVDPRIFEIYARFYKMGWLETYGNQCFLISEVLRRILRVHGIEAHLKEMVFNYNNPKKGWFQQVGAPLKITHGGNIDTHVVVVTPKLILDWAHRDSIYRVCGAMSPRGFIGVRTNNEEQDLGFFGKGKWKERKPHSGSKNVFYLERDFVKELAREYFEMYKV